jgi:hypothetical protein
LETFFCTKGASLLMSLPTTSSSIEAIDWHAATYLGSGCCGVVYAVAPGIVAKISPSIAPQEASIQAALAEEGLALPVLDYAQGVWLSPALRRAACSPHGLRRYRALPCTCHASVDVLLMPRVERTCTEQDLKHPEVIILLDRVSHRYWQLTQDWWDCHAGNVGRYQGRFVALDFGACGDTGASLHG